MVLEARNSKSRFRQSSFLLRAIREHLFHAPFLTSGGLLAILVFLGVWQQPLIITWLFPVFVSLYSNFPFYKNTSHIGLWAYSVCINVLELPRQNTTDWAAWTLEIISVLQARSPRLKCRQVWFLLRMLSLACRWPPLAVASHSLFSVCVSLDTVSKYVQIFSSKDTSQIGLRPTLAALF